MNETKLSMSAHNKSRVAYIRHSCVTVSVASSSGLVHWGQVQWDGRFVRDKHTEHLLKCFMSVANPLYTESLLLKLQSILTLHNLLLITNQISVLS